MGATFTFYLGYNTTDGTLGRLGFDRRHSPNRVSWATSSGAVSLTGSYVIEDNAVYNLPAPTRRTAPSWEVERVSRSQDPDNRNQSLARVTLVGTDQPGTWRINDGGTNVDVSAWEHNANGKTYRLGSIAVSISATWRVRDTRIHTVTPTRQTAPNWTVDRVSRSTDPTDRTRKFVRVTVADAHEPGTWRISDGTNTVNLTGWEHEANRRRYRITGIAVTFAVTWRTRDTRLHSVTPTRRTAPSWDVDRVGLTDNPNSAANRLVRVTVLGTNEPGTWRINDGTNTIDLTTWERRANNRIYRITGIAVSFAIKWRVRDTRIHSVTPTRRAAPEWLVDRVSRNTDPTDRNRKFVRVTVANAHQPGTWRINDGTRNVDLSTWSHEANNRLYSLTGITVRFAVTWKTRDTVTHTVTPTRQTAPSWEVTDVGRSRDPDDSTRSFVRVTLQNTNNPGTWRINDGTRNVDLSTWSHEANRREYRILTIAVSFAITWVLDDENVYDLTASNSTSIAAWGRRELTFPVWFARTATAALQSRIDALALPRDIHVVDFSMWQYDQARTRRVAGIKPGDYIGLLVEDESTLTAINAIAFVMHVEYIFRRNYIPIKRLTCIQTGAKVPDTFPPKFVSAETNISGSQLVLTFNEPLDESSIPALAAFVILAGRTRKSGSGRSISGNEVTIEFDDRLEWDDVITVAYNKPSSNPLEDAAGNEVESFTAQAVTNNVPEPIATAPSVSINAVATGQEGTRVTLGATIGDDGIYDGSIDYRWSVSGGTLNSATIAAPTWTRPQVTEAGNYTITLTIIVEGSGVNARDGSVHSRTATRTARVTDTPLGVGNLIAVRGRLGDATGFEDVETGTGEPIAITAQLPDSTGAALLETGSGEPIDLTATLPDATGHVLTVGTGAPIAVSAALGDGEGVITYFGTGEPIAIGTALPDGAGSALLETGAGEPIAVSAELPDATGFDIKPYPAPINVRERSRIAFGSFVQVSFEWDAPTDPPRTGVLNSYEYQTRVENGAWSSTSIASVANRATIAITVGQNEDYSCRVLAVYVQDRMVHRSEWATYSSSIAPSVGTGEPIAISAALDEGQGAAPSETGTGEPIAVTVALPDGAGSALLESGIGEPIAVTVALNEGEEPTTGLPPYSITLNDRAITLNGRALALPPPGV